MRVRPLQPSLIRLMRDLNARLDRRSDRGGLPTGFDELDRMFGGLRAGQVVVIAARPSLGATTLALNIACNSTLVKRLPVLMFSPELSTENVVRRMLVSRANVESIRVASGLVNATHMLGLLKATDELREMRAVIKDRADLSVRKLRRDADRWARALPQAADGSPNGVVIVDAVHRIGANARERRQRPPWRALAHALRTLAEEQHCSVIVTARVSKKVETRPDTRPSYSDLRPLALERVASTLVYLFRPDVYQKEQCSPEDKGIAELIIPKNDDGPIGSVRLPFRNEILRFENAKKDVVDSSAIDSERS